MAKAVNTFSMNLKAILEERKISQKGIAQLAGVPSSTVNDWLNGVNPSDPTSVLNLAKALDCDFQWLLTGTKASSNRPLSIAEVFDLEDEPSFSGIFMVEAKRLKKKKED